MQAGASAVAALAPWRKGGHSFANTSRSTLSAAVCDSVCTQAASGNSCAALWRELPLAFEGVVCLVSALPMHSFRHPFVGWEMHVDSKHELCGTGASQRMCL
jgi:hypothetical protein